MNFGGRRIGGDNSKCCQIMFGNCNIIKTLQLGGLGHEGIYSYKYKMICNVGITFNSTHESTLYVNPFIPLRKY